MRILLLQVVNMQSTCECITAEVRKPKQCRESAAAHTAHEGAFLRIKAVWEYALVAEQVELLITFAVVCFLEHRHVINAAFVQILVLIDIHRVNFDAHKLEVLAGKLASFTDVFDTAFCTAFAGEQQDLFHAAVSDDLHLVLNLFHVQLHTLDVVVAVETAIDAVVFAVVCDVERRKEVDVIAEMAASLNLCLGGHLFEERSRCRR